MKLNLKSANQIVITVIIIAIIFLLTGCMDKINHADPDEKEIEEADTYWPLSEYFTKIDGEDIHTYGDNEYTIVYANDTKVKYFMYINSYYGSIFMMPLYNEDRTLQVYEE